MRARRVDLEHAAVGTVLELLDLPHLDTSGAGGGLEDYVVGVPGCVFPMSGQSSEPRWFMLEVKSARNKRREATPSQFTPAQKKWRQRTAGYPRLTVMDASDAEKQLRALMGF